MTKIEGWPKKGTVLVTADELDHITAERDALLKIRHQMAEENSRLRAQLAEAERALLRLADAASNIYVGRSTEDWNVEELDFAILQAREALRPADSASAVQPERCCLDYPLCDCNSPPEPDNLPCGHPWKAQHDFKCILCSSPGTAQEKANE